MYTKPMTKREAFSAVDFRAPPPSPVASGRRSSFTNDDIFTEYLHQSLKVPDLFLPDRVFPRIKSTENPPILDLNKSDELENKSAHEFLEIGCLEVINHGISPEFIKLVLDLGGGIFEISREKKGAVRRSAERLYGFDEIHEEDEIISSRRDESEEFVWCGEETMRLEMEGIWSPTVFLNFSEKMEKLSGIIEEIARKILKLLQGTSFRKFDIENGLTEQEVAGKLCYIHKHCGEMEQHSENSLRYDVIRMLIRGSEYPHALCLHICNGSNEFHVYSKKGWVSFCPSYQNSILVTVGDLLQVWTGGEYKHVIGRPMYRSGDEKNIISMAFLYSPPKTSTNSSIKEDTFVTISVTQQIKFALLSIFIYQFSFFVYNILYKVFTY